MPTIYYTVREYDAVKKQVHRLSQQVQVLESLRPVWAMGHTDDDITRSTQAGALAAVWDLLGVSDQTQCMQALKRLLREDAV